MENEDVKVELEEVLHGELKKIPNMQAGSKEHEEQVRATATLYELYIKETENERSFQEKCERTLDTERELKHKMDESRKQFWLNVAGIAIDVAIPTATLIAYGLFMKMGFHFEEHGTMVSTTFRNFLSKIRPGK